MRAGAAVALLTLILVALWTVAPGPAPALAQPTKSSGKASPSSPSRPTWNQLTPAQREALAPLQGQWETIDEPRKRKWLEVAPKYHQLSPEGQQRMHARMAEFAKLTPEQRWTARENFQRAYELPADQRNSLIQQYKDLPPERKQQLNEKARAKADPPVRRAPRDDAQSAAKAAKSRDRAGSEAVK